MTSQDRLHMHTFLGSTHPISLRGEPTVTYGTKLLVWAQFPESPIIKSTAALCSPSGRKAIYYLALRSVGEPSTASEWAL